MGFLAQRFPDGISRGAVGGPEYRTIIVPLESGREYRDSRLSRGRHRYNVSQGVKTDADARLLDAFFRKARGRAHAFRFRDWLDYQLAQVDSLLQPITSTTFRLTKVYGADEPTFAELRPLTRLVAGTVTVFKDGTPVVQGGGPSQCTVAIDTGVITFGTAPGSAVLTATAEFDVPCRFDIDARRAELVDRIAGGAVLVGWENIDIVEDLAG